MKFLTVVVAVAVAACRKFSSKSSGKPRKWIYGELKKKDNAKERKQHKPKIEWTDEQMSTLAAISRGNSVFITGSAGTGKTLFLQQAIKRLRILYKLSRVSITASTGIAACALKGQTLHSFAGISNPTDNREAILDRIINNKRACKRWRNVQALVIDEISMIDADLFDNLEHIAREMKGVERVWGGIQLVVSGDFFQLPPIPNKNSSSGSVKFAFEADSWDKSFDIQIELTKIFRQSDILLIKLLQAIRTGENVPQDLEFLEQSCIPESECDPSVVRLLPLNKDVEKVNRERLNSLQKEVLVYNALDHGGQSWRRQLSLGMAPDSISICEGARVMLVKNLNTFTGLVNGATGEVVGFARAKNYDEVCPHLLLPIVKFDSGKTMAVEPAVWRIMDGDEVVAWRKQIPLILAWAFSIHKCQGMTLDRVHTNLSRAFGCGMVYVALSRVRTLKGLQLSGFTRSKIRADPKVLQFYKSFALPRFKDHMDATVLMKDYQSSDPVRKY
ncbi:ATP-dependent DNA helicase PIF1-like [Prosopis cineraria]|uniref:ATP-dependent DNA helicase PIF1-like n=1 Tax=Prosopis cineraria TaxID=364024 RepID=UPI002410AA04|nr:ATP-dependent DNA helicase PIF1-like [Prosopis cineraria]XP_054819623.1 ATP-dependent DNA helicase PIF1-like [Prosopis cineraria]